MIRAPRDRIAAALGVPSTPDQLASGPFVIDRGATPAIGWSLRLAVDGRLSWQTPAGEQAVILRRAFVENGKVFVRTDGGRFVFRSLRASDRRWISRVIHRPLHQPDLALAVRETLAI